MPDPVSSEGDEATEPVVSLALSHVDEQETAKTRWLRRAKWLVSNRDGHWRNPWHFVGNRLVTLSGQSNADVAAYGSRSYYVGLGIGILASAGIAAAGVASAFATARTPETWVLWLLGGAWFVVMCGIERWLVSDPTGGWVNDSSSRLGAIGGFLGNFSLECFRVLPRLALIFVSSLLFAELMMLTLFEKTINDQIHVMRGTATTEFATLIEETWGQEAGNIQQDLKRQEEAKVNYNSRLLTLSGELKPPQDRLNALLASGRYYTSVRCGPRLSRWCRGPKRAEAQQLEDQIAAIKERAGLDPRVLKQAERQAELDSLRLRRVNSVVSGTLTDDQGVVVNQNITTLEKEIRDRLKGKEREVPDDLLGRYKAFGILVNPDSGECKLPADASDTQRAAAKFCVPAFSPDLKRQSELWRFFLLFFEMMPIAMKFVRSVSPAAGYARAMRAKEDCTRLLSEDERDSVRQLTERNRSMRAETRKLEESVYRTETEVLLREIGRYRKLFRLDEIRRRFAKASKPVPSSGRTQIGETPGVREPATESLAPNVPGVENSLYD